VRAHTLGRLSVVVCDTITMAFRGLFHGMLALASLILGMQLLMQMIGLSRKRLPSKSPCALPDTILELGLPFTQARVLLHVSFPVWIDDPCFRSSISTVAEAAHT